jgi:hypothetical protein
MLIKSITLQRKTIGNSTNLFGILTIESQAHGKFYFSTIENNEQKIKADTYPLRYTWSPRFKQETLHIMGVNSRTGIRIHPANRGSDLQGCIGVGLCNHSDEIPNMIHSSRLSTQILEGLLWKDQNHQITIKDIKNETKITREISNSIIA